jgi:pyruvate dehydrogenase E1 component alpha subunit
MHITYPKKGIMVTTGIVGSGIPIANGLALGSQVKNDGRVTVCYFGDGASNIGAFHEGLNLASVWKLPVVFVCQNNRYAEHTRFDIGTAAAHVADRASSYSMPGFTVDGNNPQAIWDVARAALERARAGQGPTLIEALTFRFFGHVMGDQSEYIPKEEMNAAMALDPVPALRSALLAAGHATEASLIEMDNELRDEIDDALAFALESPYPDVIETHRDVYAETHA